jgi:hypothetical protein
MLASNTAHKLSTLHDRVSEGQSGHRGTRCWVHKREGVRRNASMQTVGHQASQKNTMLAKQPPPPTHTDLVERPKQGEHYQATSGAAVVLARWEAELRNTAAKRRHYAEKRHPHTHIEAGALCVCSPSALRKGSPTKISPHACERKVPK